MVRGLPVHGGVWINVIVALLLTACIAVVGCGGGGGGTSSGSSVTVNGTVNGVIRNATTGSGMPNVTVTFSNQSNSNVVVETCTTDIYGAYTATLTANTYIMRVNATGYINDISSGITVQANVTTTVEPVQQVPTSVVTGTVTGILTNAFIGQGLVGAVLSFRSGINVTTGTVALTATTTTGGAYTALGLVAGNYTVQVTLAGYTTLFFTATCIGGQTNANRNSAITPVLTTGEIRVVLTWGETPYDLDSHITGPITTSTTSKFHVYYSDRGSSTASPYAGLDVDDTTSYGPETITIYEQFSGTYKYFVHDYTNRDSTTSNALSTSSAQVKVYRGSSIIATYNVPNQAGTLWTVFTLSGNTITPINTLSFESDRSVVGVTGTVSGIIRTINGTGIAGVTIRFYNQSSTLVGTYTTDANGAYTATLTPGTYSVTVSATGYITNTVTDVTITANVTTTVEPVRPVPTTSTTGTVSGEIKNAFTGSGVVGALLSFRSGINVTTGTVVTTTTTTAAGNYTASGLAAGNYTVQVTLTGYTTLFFTVTCVGGQTTANQNTTITPVLPSGQTRVVLTWGATPSDLDSHMTGPSTTERFHVYYSSSGSSTSSPYVELDVDDTSSYGPETITIYQQSSGTYRYSIHDYSNDDSTTSSVMAASSAQVKVYRGSSLVATFNVPNQAGTLWTVFELNDNTITPINTMTFESNSGNVRSVDLSALHSDAPLMRNLPPKK